MRISSRLDKGGFILQRRREQNIDGKNDKTNFFVRFCLLNFWSRITLN